MGNQVDRKKAKIFKNYQKWMQMRCGSTAKIHVYFLKKIEEK